MCMFVMKTVDDDESFVIVVKKNIKILLNLAQNGNLFFISFEKKILQLC